MNRTKLACQTITFGPEQSGDFPAVLAAVAAAGYAGVEVGFRHFAALPPGEFGRMLDDAGLSLVASHVGGNLQDTEQAGGERRMIEAVLDALDPLGTKLLMYSGLRQESDEQLARELGGLSDAARVAADAGVRLLYHNHDWEFADGRRVMDAILRDAPDELGLCPDIGWVMKGGEDVRAFLHETADRIGALHFKDFATTDPGVDTVLLGEGAVPLKKAAEWVQTSSPDLWVIAEQDSADVPAADAVAANARYLRSIFDR